MNYYLVIFPSVPTVVMICSNRESSSLCLSFRWVKFFRSNSVIYPFFSASYWLYVFSIESRIIFLLNALIKSSNSIAPLPWLSNNPNMTFTRVYGIFLSYCMSAYFISRGDNDPFPSWSHLANTSLNLIISSASSSSQTYFDAFNTSDLLIV